MRPSLLFPVGAGAGLVGLVLLVVESARALSGNTLGTIATVVMWVGVGLVALGALLLLTVTRAARSDGGQPAHG